MRKVRMALAAFAGVTLSVGGFASTALADPPGNNGTVKIDAEEFDTHPDNEPHVGCQFQVDFYGFDEGNLNADVEFAVHPPTGQDVVLLDDTVFIGEDAAGGGTDLDAERTYDLSSALESLFPHPQQGFHVKLTVHADGSQGAETKHKVFWVQRCETNPT
jgi:ABC-type glycerol-3-phosphate transport system substrate-binding protein